MSERKLWLFKSNFDPSDLRAVAKVLTRGTYWAEGPEVEALEAAIAGYVGRRYAIAFNSGTSALYAALRAIGVAGGEVIVPSFTYPATANAVVAAGGKPVFADISGLGRPTLDWGDVARCLTERTRAIVPVHFAGGVADSIFELRVLAEQRGVALVEDAAHSLGAAMENKRVGAFGEAAMFSFAFNKLISTGEGGMLVTDDCTIASGARRARMQGKAGNGKFMDWGCNLAMSSMTAALGGSQFKRIDRLIYRRRQSALLLMSVLQGLPLHVLPVEKPKELTVYQTFHIVLHEPCHNQRDEMAAFLKERGVPTRVTYPPVHLMPYYRSRNDRELPVTEQLSKRILTLPFHPDLGGDDLVYIAECVRSYFEGES